MESVMRKTMWSILAVLAVLACAGWRKPKNLRPASLKPRNLKGER